MRVCVLTPRCCADRYATHDYWMSSKAKPWQPKFAQGGIFATDGSSAWGNANRVYVKCVAAAAASALGFCELAPES